MSYLAAACIILQVLSSSACKATEGTDRRPVTGQDNVARPRTNGMDPELTRLIKTFSEDVGENGRAAWQRLQSYPREDLINSLLKLRHDLPKDSPMQYSIAFVLCNVNYEYQANVRVIVSALTKVPHEQNYDADSAASMLGRLIHRGDKELLRVLFGAVPWSDGALAEGLSDAFSEELRSEPKEFLTRLKNEPKDTRSKIYTLIASGLLNAKDLQNLKGQLASLPRTSPIFQVAKELLASEVFKNSLPGPSN